MNIFYLDKHPEIAAQYACDKHCVKMILETAQLLSTAHRVLDGRDLQMNSLLEEKTMYKATHINHPSAKWVRESAYNYRWLYLYFCALNEEYKLRYKKDKNHLSFAKLKDLLHNPPMKAPVNKIGTEPPTCMPDECKIPGNVVESYRKYYIMKKRSFATWKSPAKTPVWFENGLQQSENIKLGGDK